MICSREVLQQVGIGFGTLSNDPFGQTQYTPLMWNGSGASAVSLYPSSLANVYSAEALGTNGTQQVGLMTLYQNSNYSNHAVVWSGTGSSAVDLNGFLPTNTSWVSIASSVDLSGDVFGIGITANNTKLYGVEWIPRNSSSPVVVAPGVQFQIAASGLSTVSTFSVSGITINANGSAAVATPANASGRQLVQISGTGGIASTAADSDTRHLTALGVLQNNQSGSALFTASNPFDRITPGAGDILVKYTYRQSPDCAPLSAWGCYGGGDGSYGWNSGFVWDLEPWSLGLCFGFAAIFWQNPPSTLQKLRGRLMSASDKQIVAPV